MSDATAEREAWVAARARWEKATDAAAACLAPPSVMLERVGVDPDHILAVRHAQRQWEEDREAWARHHAGEDVEAIRAAAMAELDEATTAFRAAVTEYRTALTAAGLGVPEDFKGDVYAQIVAPALATERRTLRWSPLPDARETIDELLGDRDAPEEDEPAP